MENPIEQTLLTYDLSVLILQWLKLPDLMRYGRACSASRSILQLHFQRLKRVPPNEFPEYFHSNMLVSLLQRAPNLSYLALYANRIIGDGTLYFGAVLSETLCELHLSYLQDRILAPPSVPPLPRLRVLNLSGSKFEYDVLMGTLSHAPGLKVLRLHGSTCLPEGSITGDGLLMQLCSTCTVLTTLDLTLSCFTGVSPNGIRAFLHCCPNIQELGLAYVMAFKEVTFLLHAFSYPRYALRALSLANIEADRATFLNFSSTCTTLQRLHLMDCNGLPIRDAILRMPSLTELSLAMANISKEDMAAILNHCSRLQRLCFIGEATYEAEMCTPSAPFLRELSCDLLSLSYLGNPAVFFKAATSLLSLRIFTLGPLGATPNPESLQFLSTVAEQGAHMRALTLAFEQDHLPLFLRSLGSFKALRVLSLVCLRLSTVDVEQILRACPKLQWLGLWPSFFSGDGKAMDQLMKEYSFRVRWLNDGESAFDITLYDDYCLPELWAD